jgi:serine phosphatase RsbU (regulator of sigma subunit)
LPDREESAASEAVTDQERQDIARLRRRIEELDEQALVREGRITELLSQAFDLEHEIRDYAAMRDVLTPTELRAGPGLEVECSFTPATDGVAGDFYVVTPGPDENSTILAVGDVSGKGAESARRATFVRTALATFAGFVDEPCQLLELSNQVLVERAGPSTIFVTAVVAVLRPQEGRLSWASAGHPPPLLLDSGELLNGHKPAPPLGIDPTITCHSGEIELAPSAGVLLFTDGVTEAHRSRQELFGERRLTTVVRELAGLPPDEVIRKVEAAVLEHSGASLADDLCIVAARVVTP